MAETAVICAIALNEELYLPEWVKYHLSLGFDHIYIYDNSEDHVLANIWSSTTNVTVRHLPGPLQQFNAYNSFIREFGGKHTWCAFIDVDEFIVLRKHASIVDFMREYAPYDGTAGAVGLNWFMFGNSGHTEYKPEPVVQRFMFRHGEVNEHVKTIVRLDSVVNIDNPHFARLKPSKYHVDTNGTVITGAHNVNGPTDVACIHHYFWKSEAEFRKKIERGRADVGAKRTMEEYADANRNEVFDPSAWHIWMHHLA